MLTHRIGNAGVAANETKAKAGADPAMGINPVVPGQPSEQSR